MAEINIGLQELVFKPSCHLLYYSFLLLSQQQFPAEPPPPLLTQLPAE
jgi:hypothetical protein